MDDERQDSTLDKPEKKKHRGHLQGSVREIIPNKRYEGRIRLGDKQYSVYGKTSKAPSTRSTS